MAASVSTSEGRRLKQQSPRKLVSDNNGSPQQIEVRDTKKRRCVASTDAAKKKKTETAKWNASLPEEGARVANGTLYHCLDETARLHVYVNADREQCEEKREFPAKGVVCEVEDEGGGGVSVHEEIATGIAVIAAKNEQLHVSVTSLKRKFSLREDHAHQLLLGLGALNAVTNELAALQKDYQERSCKNTALVQELLVHISNCSAQVDTLKKSRGLKAKQLHKFKQECAQEMNRLIARLGDLAESACQEPNPEEGKDDDGLCTAASMRENLQQVEQLKEACEHRVQVIDDRSVESSGGRSQQETTDRINLALEQLDNLHADMFQLKQTLVQDNQSFRRHLEDHLSRHIAHTRELQDNERERMYEEMDEIRSGMCGILKDIHRLKERTKYLVPSMAPLEVIGRSSKDRWMTIQTPAAAMPHERSYDWVMPSPLDARCTKSGSSSPGRSGDENRRMFTPEDAPATGQRATQLCESPHFSSRSSSLSGRLSVYGGTSTCVQTTGRPACPEKLARGRSANCGTKWRRINIVDCARLRRREWKADSGAIRPAASGTAPPFLDRRRCWVAS